MARKTRKEKIIADLRRKLHVQKITENMTSYEKKTSSSNLKPVSIKKTSSLYSVKPSLKENSIQSPLPSPSITASYDFKYIKNDLRKTFFLTIFVLVFEFVLYWILELGGINNLKQ